MPPDPLTEAKLFLERAPVQVQRAVLAWLRTRYPIHKLEREWRVPAEVILEAIARSPDLSQRGVRGLIAEAYFDQVVSTAVQGWEKDTPEGNHAFDCVLRRGGERVRIQVKSQRKKAQRPMLASEAYKRLSPDKFVVETQRTRAGTDAEGQSTRPYRFGEFDLLAVNMEAATGDWTQFRYTVESWLLPRLDEPTQLLKFQPVPLAPNDDWTDHLGTAIGWLLSGKARRIAE